MQNQGVNDEKMEHAFSHLVEHLEQFFVGQGILILCYIFLRMIEIFISTNLKTDIGGHELYSVRIMVWFGLVWSKPNLENSKKEPHRFGSLTDLIYFFGFSVYFAGVAVIPFNQSLERSLSFFSRNNTNSI